MSYRKNSFEGRIDSLLPEGDSFSVKFFELWREAEGGWSVNDAWWGQREGDRVTTIELLRDRWEVFKLNYLSRANVKDISDISFEEGECCLEVCCTAFADVKKVEVEQ
tara:strand:+ start:7761 stop:8084 length:324 start_codon:yes stop_codon:yes gene_type:complete